MLCYQPKPHPFTGSIDTFTVHDYVCTPKRAVVSVNFINFINTELPPFSEASNCSLLLSNYCVVILTLFDIAAVGNLTDFHAICGVFHSVTIQHYVEISEGSLFNVLNAWHW